MEYIFNMDNFLFLLKGLYYTLFITISSMFFGLIIGIISAIARVWGSLPFRLLSRFYVSILRGTPMLITIFIVYYGFTDFGIELNANTAAIISLSVGIGAYLSEAFRASILSVPKGQKDAAISLQMSSWQTIRRIILPQAARTAIPPMGNQFIQMLKETSLLSAIAVTELTRSAELLISQYYTYLPFYLEIAVMYWVLSLLLSSALNRLEARLSKPFI